MNRILIKLDSMAKVKGFVDIVNDFEGEIKLISGRYSVDGKSIMGIYSLDLKNELVMDIKPESDSSGVIHKLEPYIIAGV